MRRKDRRIKKSLARKAARRAVRKAKRKGESIRYARKIMPGELREVTSAWERSRGG